MKDLTTPPRNHFLASICQRKQSAVNLRDKVLIEPAIEAIVIGTRTAIINKQY